MKKWLAMRLRAIANWIAPPATAPTVKVGPPRRTTPYDQAWDKALSEYLLAVGTNTRAIAAAWGTSAVGLLAVIGGASILKGRETLDGLADPPKYAAAALVFIALIAAFLTLYVAAEAAQGSPSPQLMAPNTFREAQFAAAASAARLMARSRRWVQVAFLAAASATAIVLVGPAAEKPNLTLVVGGPKGDQIACGKLAVKDGALTVGGVSAPNPPIAFHTVAECGK